MPFMNKIKHTPLQGLFSGILLMSLWQAITYFGKMPSYILPTPWQVVKAFNRHISLIGWHFVITSSQVFSGLLIASLVGIGLAILLDRYDFLQRWVHPIFVMMQATPSFILMPLLLIWCGFGFLPKMIVVCLSGFFPITLCLLSSLKQTPSDWLDLAAVMKASSFQVTKIIRWPAALPGLFSGIKLAAIYAPLTVLAADWSGANEGLGYLIMLCHGRLQTDLMFACLLCIILLTLLLNRFIYFLESKFIFWPSQI